MKRFAIALVLALICLGVLCVAASAEIVKSGVCGMNGDNVTWTLDEDGVLTISGTGEMANYSITWVNQNTQSTAPWGAGIKKVIIQSGVTSIGDYAFGDCSQLSNVTIPSSISSIGTNAFRGCGSLASIVIPQGVTNIGSYAFYYCTGLTSVTVPGTVTTVGNSAFSCCTQMTAINVDATNTNYSSLDGVLFNANKTTLLNFPGNKAGEYNIPESVTKIGDGAFSDCSNLTSVVIPDSVTDMGWNAFSGCTKLESVNIPINMTSIAWSAFSGCTSLKSLSIPNSITRIDVYAFSGCSGLTSIIIPDSVTSIGDHAFNQCTGLTSVKISENIISIPFSLFENCSSLASVIIPEGVTSIGSSAFSGCRSLTSVTIPATVTSIENNAFQRISSNAVFNVQCESAGWDYAAKNDYKCAVEHNYVDGVCTRCGIDTSIVDYGKCGTDLTWKLNNENVLTISGTGAMTNYTYQQKAPWGTGIAQVIFEEGVTSIGNYAFDWCTKLTNVTIPEGVTRIGDSAFRYCKITHLTIPSTVTSIGNQTFYCCDKLTDVAIPEGVTSISHSAFSYCKMLTDVTIPEGVISIGEYAFSWCDGLKSVAIPASVTSIGNNAFQSNSLKAVFYVPCQSTAQTYAANNGIKCILEHSSDDGICSRCGYDTGIVNYGKCGENLTWKLSDAGTLTISGTGRMTDYNYNMTWTTGSAVYKTTAPWSVDVKKAIIENGATGIGASAFCGCSSLKSISIPESVISIGGFAFYGCDSLASLAIPEGVTSINDWAFSDDVLLRTPCESAAQTCITDKGYRCELQHDIGDDGICVRCGNDASIVCYGKCGDDVSWTLSDAGMLVVSGTGEMDDFDDHGPWGKEVRQATILSGVTSIGDCAFSDCKNMVSVAIPEGVSTIGDYAFETCRSLTDIAIPDSVTGIGRNAFRACIGLTSVTIPTGTTSIGAGAFIYCKNLESMTIPEGVTSINSGTFTGCSSLTSLTLPDSVTNISTGDEEDTIPRTVTIHAPCGSASYTWATGNGYSCVLIHDPDESGVCRRCGKDAGVACYGTCGENLRWEIDDAGVLTITGTGQMTDYWPRGPWGTAVKQAVLESGVTSIGDYAFLGCSSLTGVTIPNSVTSIGYEAFSGCSSLTSVTIPDSVTSIGSSAFRDCSGLTSVTIPDSVTSIGDRAFVECSSLTSMAIPNGVNSIEESLFYGCSSLTNVTIPDSVTSIGDYAFLGCSSLTGVTIPNSVTSIGYEAFSGCSSLTSVTIPDSVTSIEQRAFNRCISLTSVTLPESVTTIDPEAFMDCKSGMRIAIPDSVTEIGSNAFLHTAIIVTPCQSVAHTYALQNGINCELTHAYNDADTCSRCGHEKGQPDDSAAEFMIQNGVLLWYTGAGGAVAIPDGVTRIGDSAFRGCSELTSVSIPESVKNIGEYAFAYCTGLTEIVIPGGVTSIGSAAFSNCSGLTSMTIPASVSDIGYGAFWACENLTDAIILGDKTRIKSVDEYYDYDASFDGTVTIHCYRNSEAEEWAWSNGNPIVYLDVEIPSLDELDVLYLPAGLKFISAEAFAGSACQAVVVPTGCESIGARAFANCPNLIYAKVPAGTVIAENAFADTVFIDRTGE